MPAARYWRVIGIETYGAGALELSEFQLYAGATRVDNVATLTCSHLPSVGSLASLKDNDTATVCRFSAAAVRSAGFWLQWDMGTAVDVTNARLEGAAQLSDFVAVLVLQSSTDAVAWSHGQSLGRYVFPGANVLQAAPTAAGDPDFTNVVLLVSGDGAPNSTTFIDSSLAARPLTAYGDVKISTVQSKFGSSIHFDGTGDYIQSPASSDFAFGTGDFTIEFWAWKLGNGSGGYDTVLTTDTSNGSAIDGWFLEMSASRGVLLARNGAFGVTYATNPNDSEWCWWEVSRRSGVSRIFRQGVQVASAADTGDYKADGIFGVGGSTTSSSYRFNGYLRDIRITKGLGRNIADYAPPPAPLPASVGGGGLVFEPLGIQTTPVFAKVAASAPVASHDARTVPSLLLARDTEFGGLGRIYGFTKIEPSPGTKVPTKARVDLLRQRDKLLARETWSDPVTGAWEFQGIDTAQEFIAVAEDADGNYRPVAANKTVPEAV